MMAQTKMRKEICEIPNAIQCLLDRGERHIDNVVSRLKNRPLPFLLSVARGSSDHACTYLKYASELLLGLPMASMGPSVASIYQVQPRTPNALCLAISQSGESPDIVSMVSTLKKSGATTVAITNSPDSSLGTTADATIPIFAGEERSVAATKTFIASLIAGLWLLAKLSDDVKLQTSIKALPEHLAKAIECDWSVATEALKAGSMYTLGRGPSWAASNEAALKFKETCQIHAESYSSAEILHGPVSLVNHGFPVIGFAAKDAAEQVTVEICDYLAKKGATVFVTSTESKLATPLPNVRTQHWLTDPIALIVSFYCLIEEVAVLLGVDPDQPPHLQKVTLTR